MPFAAPLPALASTHARLPAYMTRLPASLPVCLSVCLCVSSSTLSPSPALLCLFVRAKKLFALLIWITNCIQVQQNLIKSLAYSLKTKTPDRLYYKCPLTHLLSTSPSSCRFRRFNTWCQLKFNWLYTRICIAPVCVCVCWLVRWPLWPVSHSRSAYGQTPDSNPPFLHSPFTASLPAVCWCCNYQRRMRTAGCRQMSCK